MDISTDPPLLPKSPKALAHRESSPPARPPARPRFLFFLSSNTPCLFFAPGRPTTPRGHFGAWPLARAFRGALRCPGAWRQDGKTPRAGHFEPFFWEIGFDFRLEGRLSAVCCIVDGVVAAFAQVATPGAKQHTHIRPDAFLFQDRI